MNILVTGATGFIGYNLVFELLKKKKVNIDCIIRNPAKTLIFKETNITNKNQGSSHISYQRLNFIKLDLNNFEEINSIDFSKYDFIYHLAGITKSFDNDIFFKINFLSTKYLLDKIKKKKCIRLKRFIYFSSLAAAGPTPDNITALKESYECKPINSYGESKRLGEEEVLKYADYFPVLIIRPPAVYGPFDKDVYSLFKMSKFKIFPITGSEKKRVSLIYVKDLVKNTVRAAEKIKSNSEVVFISNTKEYTWLDIHKVFGRIFNKKIYILKIPYFVLSLLGNINEILGKILKKDFLLNRDKLNEIRMDNWVCSNNKIRTLLDNEYVQTNLFDGFKETYNWYKKNNWL